VFLIVFLLSYVFCCCQEHAKHPVQNVMYFLYLRDVAFSTGSVLYNNGLMFQFSQSDIWVWHTDSDCDWA